MSQEFQPYDYHNIQFWLNDQYAAKESQLMLQYPHNILLAESYQPVDEQQELLNFSFQQQQQFPYSNYYHTQLQEQDQQDVFHIDDFDYLYNTEEFMVSSSDISGPSSPSCSMSSSTLISVNDLPHFFSPEPEQSQIIVQCASPAQDSSAITSIASKIPTGSPSPTKRTRTGSKANSHNYDQYCHQSLVLTPASQESKPFACHLCPRRFARKHDLQRHIRVHTCAKPYSCLSCAKSFARTDALKRHLRMEEKCRQSPIIQAMKEKGCRRYRNL